MTNNQTADRAYRITLDAFDAFNRAFREITQRAQKRFEEKDWQGGSDDAVERFDLYEKTLDSISIRLEDAFGARAHEQPFWLAAKASFAEIIADRYDIERAETFFNSVTRKMLHTVGINREVEFFYLYPQVAKPQKEVAAYRIYDNTSDTKSIVRRILTDFSFRVGYENIERDADFIAQEIDLYLWPITGPHSTYTYEIVDAIFYRNKVAYIIGRIVVGAQIIPLIIPLANGDRGISAEAVLMSPSDVKIIFSFAYSYFFVDVERYDALIEFLQSIIPYAQRAELYNSLGYNRHGKTEFYRNLHRFVHISREQFEIAPGLEGAVMIAFTLPSYEFVFKVIKDHPCFLRSQNQTSKMITKDQVREQYDFVSHRDRAGRMVDTQEFEYLRFKKYRFSEELLNEFTQAATNTVRVTDDMVIMEHVYVQRKVTPLPLYFKTVKDPEALRGVLIDFGYFLKDIAASGVFPCDLFNTWNYGVTNWGRVVLYDYDDVLPIEKIRFREKPTPRNEDEEFAPEEEWITATREDFFMDEIDRYSGIPRPLKGIFKSVHGDLYALEYWHTLIDRLNRGELFDVIPYDRARQFCNRAQMR